MPNPIGTTGSRHVGLPSNAPPPSRRSHIEPTSARQVDGRRWRLGSPTMASATPSNQDGVRPSRARTNCWRLLLPMLTYAVSVTVVERPRLAQGYHAVRSPGAGPADPRGLREQRRGLHGGAEPPRRSRSIVAVAASCSVRDADDLRFATTTVGLCRAQRLRTPRTGA